MNDDDRRRATAPDTDLSALTRRQALVSLGAAGVATLAGCPDLTTDGAESNTNAGTNSNTNSGDETPSCVLTPEATDGPYFVDELLNRSDIRSDPTSGDVQDGVTLKLRLTVRQKSGSDCSNLAGAIVDIWHCNAEGDYSDVAANRTVGEKFLRGYQTTDSSGVVEFTTIYPGWYSGRTVHIHVKIRVDSAEFTTQLYFDEGVTADVFAKAPYSARGAADTTNTRDNIFDESTVLNLATEGDGYIGTFDVALQL